MAGKTSKQSKDPGAFAAADTSAAEVNPRTGQPYTEHEIMNLTHPAAVGEVDLEISKRSAEHEAIQAGELPAGKWIRRFRITADTPELTEEAIEQNAKAVLTEAINQGVHPKDDVELLSQTVTDERYRGNRTVYTIDVIYGVDVVPSVIDDQAATTVAPSRPHADTPKPSDRPSETYKAEGGEMAPEDTSQDVEGAENAGTGAQPAEGQDDENKG
jgi:hypothetical protein